MEIDFLREASFCLINRVNLATRFDLRLGTHFFESPTARLHFKLNSTRNQTMIYRARIIHLCAESSTTLRIFATRKICTGSIVRNSCHFSRVASELNMYCVYESRFTFSCVQIGERFLIRCMRRSERHEFANQFRLHTSCTARAHSSNRRQQRAREILFEM